jgi:histidinol-phosphate aminotransferase
MNMSRREMLAASALLLARPVLVPAAEGTTTTAAGAKPIILCWNENPYGPSPAARAAVSATIPFSCRYPDEENKQLIDAIAEHERVGADHLVLGTGSGELLRALGFLHGQGGGEIIAAQPTYSELTDYARYSGASLKFVPVDKELKHDLNAMRAAISDRTRAIYVCNPNNPTGTAVQARQIEAFVNAVPDHVTVIVDEAYMDFADLQGVASVSGLVAQGKRIVILRTFSKIHGMAGIRMGYAISRPDISKDLAAATMTSPNIFAVRAARASLGDHAFLTDTRDRIIASRRKITTELTRLGRPFAVPQGNFVFFDTGMPLAQFTGRMQEHNILVGRPFPPYDNWCRITIGTEHEVVAFLQALRAIAPSQSA